MKGAIPPSEVQAGRASPQAPAGHGHSATIPIAGHTPGPWRLSAAGIVRADEPHSGRHQAVADILFCSDIPAVEREANARLIAAAPELLEALEKARLKLAYIYEVTDDTHCGNEARLTGNEIALVIAKARGQ